MGIPMDTDCASQLDAVVAWWYEKFKGVHDTANILENSYQRYLNDGLMLWTGDYDSLQSFMDHLSVPLDESPFGPCRFDYTFKASLDSAFFLMLHSSKALSMNVMDI